MIRPRVWQVVVGLLVFTDLASAGLARRAVPDVHITHPQSIQAAIDAARQELGSSSERVPIMNTYKSRPMEFL